MRVSTTVETIGRLKPIRVNTRELPMSKGPSEAELRAMKKVGLAAAETMLSAMNRRPNVTGRDDMIVNTALAYAILTIQRLPAERRARSDTSDMEAILRHQMPDEAQRSALMDQVARTLYE